MHGFVRGLVGLGCLVVPLTGTVACGGDGAGPPAGGSSRAAGDDLDVAALQAVIAGGVAPDGPVPGRLAAVLGRDGDLAWEGASGRLDRADPEPLRPGDAVRIASVTKTFTAAATLRLGEDGALGLDDPIRPLISPESAEVLAGGGYDVDAITVRHLLTHTSGLPDHASSEAQALYPAAVLADPTHRWTRLDQIRFAVDHYAPVGAPGETHSYSDTGFVLLGEIVERASGRSLGDAYRELLRFASLGLTSTWWEGSPHPPEGVRRAHQEADGIDAYGLDPSFDLYGGGGLVSTMPDLTRFFGALLAGRVFTEPATLDTMLTVPPVSASDGYAMGISRYDIDGRVCRSHTGFWGWWRSPAPTTTSRSPPASTTPRPAATTSTRWPTCGASWRSSTPDCMANESGAAFHGAALVYLVVYRSAECPVRTEVGGRTRL